MLKNKLKQIWQDGEVVINGWMHIPSTWSAEVMANAGWDSLTVDMQHGMHSMESAIQLIQAINITDTVPIVRVNWNTPGEIMRLLDAGAYGIICPMINTRGECEAFVGACRYPPQGYRSLGPTRARLYAGADYADHANDETLTIAMVETKEALDNVDAIASVPGLDMIFIGVGDLRLSMMGTVGLDTQDDAIFDKALQDILDACERHNILAGVFTASSEYARKMIKQGFKFVTVKTDTMLLSEYAKQVIEETRK
jgi:4-hydroxy-2-oxoheptanedioate aldolase